MKRWEKLAAESLESAVKNHRITWEHFARTGKCLGISCDNCPFKDAEVEYMENCPPYDVRMKHLNEEVGDEQ